MSNVVTKFVSVLPHFFFYIQCSPAAIKLQKVKQKVNMFLVLCSPHDAVYCRTKLRNHHRLIIILLLHEWTHYHKSYWSICWQIMIMLERGQSFVGVQPSLKRKEDTAAQPVTCLDMSCYWVFNDLKEKNCKIVCRLKNTSESMGEKKVKMTNQSSAKVGTTNFNILLWS